MGAAMPVNTVQNSSENSNTFQPANFFTPGWSGDSLLSKNGIKIRKIVLKLWSDSINQFKGLSQANPTLQDLIFKQFKNHCLTNNLKINELLLNDSSFLIREIGLPNSKINPAVLDFIRVFSFKSITLYLYKVKFLSKLSDHLELDLDEQMVRNPSYFFQKIFKNTSQNSVVIQSLQKNLYSWYRPSSTINLDITPIVKVLESISIIELMKITSFSNYIDTQKTFYPHSISHLEFGKLINELIIHFPAWIEEKVPTRTSNLEVISAKFSGEHVTSLSQSHWLAQRSSNPVGWSKLIFPHFEQEDCKDPYIKFCHELQFLSFLVSLSTVYNKDPVKYIIEVYRDKNKIKHKSNGNFGQTNLFDQFSDDRVNPIYHRSILNLSNLPKKNPHHYLTTQIINEFDKICDNGYLIVLTNQKLFVPSYQDKVKQVLQIGTLEAEFNLENLNNKGEVPEFIYIFSKNGQNNKFLNNDLESNKSSYIAFSFEGKLSQFQLLKLFTEDLKNIWLTKKATTPIYQKDLSRNFSLKFHQSVILDGKTLENENQSQNSITHPNFYRNLAINSLTLDNFFKIELQGCTQIIRDDRENLFDGLQFKKQAPYVLIVHTPDYLANSIEIIPSDSLEAKKQQYGEAFFQYYDLTPISRSININVFREYFNSSIGRQIIKLTLGGATTKIKSKIRSLLVPKSFLTPPGTLTTKLPNSFSILNLKIEELCSLSTASISEKLEHFFRDSEELKQIDPNLLISCLSHLNIKLQHVLNASRLKNKIIIDFNNNDFVSEISELKLSPIYPSNPDAFIEFNSNDKLSLYGQASKINVEHLEDGQKALKIFVADEPCLTIFSSENLISFISGLLSQFNNFKPADLLQSLKIPTIKDLDQILERNKIRHNSLENFSTKTNQLINQVITSLIS